MTSGESSGVTGNGPVSQGLPPQGFPPQGFPQPGFPQPGLPPQQQWNPQWTPQQPDPRFGVQCRRCARTQPVAPGLLSNCVYCGAVMPRQGWRAHPPPLEGTGFPSSSGATSPASAAGSLSIRRGVTQYPVPYPGPPSYGPWHPRWGFPPVVWRRARPLDTLGDSLPGSGSGDALLVPPQAEVAAAASRVIGRAAFAMTLAVCTAVAALVAAGGEAWRFRLLLAGRTAVLSGDVVHRSDGLVQIAGLSALVLGVVTACVAVPLIVDLYRVAAWRRGRIPGRPGAAVVSRLVVPGWNLYGAGQVLYEIARMLRPRGAPRVLLAWWAVWGLNGVLALGTLLAAFGRSNQWMANTVEWHVAVDVAAAAAASLFAVVLGSWRRMLTGNWQRRWSGWVVQLPSTGRDDEAAYSRDAATPESTGVASSASTTSAT